MAINGYLKHVCLYAFNKGKWCKGENAPKVFLAYAVLVLDLLIHINAIFGIWNSMCCLTSIDIGEMDCGRIHIARDSKKKNLNGIVNGQNH